MALTATGSTVRHTSPSRIKDYKFGLPLNEEQQEIAKILQSFDIKIAALEQEDRTTRRTIPRHARRTDDRTKIRRAAN